MLGRRIFRFLATLTIVGASIGVSTAAAHAAPASVATAITAGVHHSCAIVGSVGAVKCWGYNNHGHSAIGP